MNKQRRAAIRSCEHDLHQLIAQFQDWDTFVEADGTQVLTDVASRVCDLKDEEQDYYDNMPESLQASEKGDAAQAAIDALQEVEDSLNQLDPQEEDFDADSLTEVIESLCEQLEEAAA